MASVSQFSTVENYQKSSDAIRQLEAAIAEAEIAVRAGVPGAQTVLDNAKAGLQKVEQFRATYFPNGQPASE